MRTVFRHKSYDTETARLIGRHEVASSEGGQPVTEGLYRKRTGEHFVCVTGGASDRFPPRRRRDGYIVPLGYEEALAWARECLDPEKLEAEFGSGDLGGDSMLSVRVSATAIRALDLWSSRTGEGKGETIDRLILEHLA